MNNIIIDDTIISTYLQGNDVSIHRNDEVFTLGVNPDGTPINVFTDPNYALVDKAKLITHGFIEEIKKINFSENPKITKFIENIKELESFITIKLVCGLPHGIRRMFRASSVGSGIIIVIDVINGLNEDDSNDLYIEEFSNYIKYAILLMLLDSTGTEEDEASINTLAHAIHSASFAEYLSGTNQLEKLEDISLIKFWEFTEYQTIKKVLKKKKGNHVSSYMGMIVHSNPEMVVLGITGKRFLSDIDDEDEIYQLFIGDKIEFLNKIIKNGTNKDAIMYPRMFGLLNRLSILLVTGYIAWSIAGFIFGEQLYNSIFYIYPLISFVVWILRDLYAYKLEIKSMKQFLISSGIVSIISIIYMLLVF